MTIDEFFVKCDLLAKKYEVHACNIFIIYRAIGREQKLLGKPYDLDTVTKLVDTYFRIKKYEEN